MRHGAASRLARATHDWRRARGPRYNIAASRLARATHDWCRACEPRYNIAASRLARATHDWRRARGPRYNIAASRLARATHGVDRPRGPRYNIAGSRLVSGHPRSRPPSRSPLQHRRVAPRLRPPTEQTALAVRATTSPGPAPPPATHGARRPRCPPRTRTAARLTRRHRGRRPPAARLPGHPGHGVPG